MLWIVSTHGLTLGPGLKLLKTILTDFFWPQFKTKWFGDVKKVRPVDHNLDAVVPFRPAEVKIYLSFVHLWFKTQGYMFKMKGESHLPSLREFLLQMNELYFEAGWVYKKLQSTTKRPPKVRSPHFFLIYLFDPHFHCLPSLHVMVVVFNYFKLNGGISGEEAAHENGVYAYDQALRITESVLLVKQHSVNCVAASLYMLIYCLPDFTPEEARSFINNLFPNETEKGYTELKLYINKLLNTFLERSHHQTEYKKVLVDFIENYAA